MNLENTSFFDKMVSVDNTPVIGDVHESDGDTPKNVGDTETHVPANVQRCLVHLYKNGVLFHDKHPHLYQSAVSNRGYLDGHFGAVGVETVFDEAAGMILTRAAARDDEHSDITLVEPRNATLLDSIILLQLRKEHMANATEAGGRPIISLERIADMIAHFMPLTNHEKLEHKKIRGALDKFLKRRILARVRGSEDRFEITPLIRYVITAESAKALLDNYTSHLKQQEKGER